MTGDPVALEQRIEVRWRDLDASGVGRVPETGRARLLTLAEREALQTG